MLAYTQADVECELYMVIPKGFELEDDAQDYVLKLKKILFGQEQAGRVWNHHLVDKLNEVGFIPSEIDECLFYKGKSVYVLYTDDSILTGPDPQELDDIFQEIVIPSLVMSAHVRGFYVRMGGPQLSARTVHACREQSTANEQRWRKWQHVCK
jgi:hypothetical protein